MKKQIRVLTEACLVPGVYLTWADGGQECNGCLFAVENRCIRFSASQSWLEFTCVTAWESSTSFHFSTHQRLQVVFSARFKKRQLLFHTLTPSYLPSHPQQPVCVLCRFQLASYIQHSAHLFHRRLLNFYNLTAGLFFFWSSKFSDMFLR